MAHEKFDFLLEPLGGLEELISYTGELSVAPYVHYYDMAFNYYSAFANSCPLQTDTFLFPLIHIHHVQLSSNEF